MPATQPIFQPVTLNDLPALPIMICALPHGGQGRDRDVPATVEDKVLVHLVCDDDKVVPLGELGDHRELRWRKHLAGRVVGRVEQDRPGAARDRGSQFVGVEAPSRVLVRCPSRRSVTVRRCAPASVIDAAYES